MYVNIVIWATAFCACYPILRAGEMLPANETIKQNNKIVNLSYDCRYLQNLTRNVTPENTIFAFDLHEVLFRRNFRKIAYGGMWLFCKSFFYMIAHPTLISRLISISYEDIAVEGMYVKLTEEYPYLSNFQEDVCEISNNCCRPIEPMIDLLRALKKQGFKIFLLSNLGENTLQDFKLRFNYFEELFDGFYSPGKQNNYICKPMIAFYEGFKNYLSSLGYLNKQILFVDDLEKNIKGACQAGMSGIHFIGYEKLCGTLQKLGISIK